jgi:hypothetical protein
MNYTSKFESVWDALIDDPDDDFRKKSDYSLLEPGRLKGLFPADSDQPRFPQSRLPKPRVPRRGTAMCGRTYRKEYNRQ